MTDQGQDRIPSGYVRRAHGTGGDVVIRGMLSDAAERFVVGAVLESNEDEPREFEIEAVRGHQGDYIISFAGFGDRNAADALRGVQFAIQRSDRRQLAEREWWPEDLVGCQVVDTAGEPIGEVTEVVVRAAQDRLVVRQPSGAQGDVPFVAALVPKVDTNQRLIVADLPEGLFE